MEVEAATENILLEQSREHPLHRRIDIVRSQPTQ